MSKSTMIWFIVGGALILAGAVLFCLVMNSIGWDFMKLDTAKYETNAYESEEIIESVNIVTDTSDVIFKPSEDGRVKVECLERKNAKHLVTFKDGALEIKINDTRKWFDYISLFSFKSTKITVYLPVDKAVKLDVHLSTGDVKIPAEIKLLDAQVSISTGDVECSASASGDIKIKGSTGDVRLLGVSADDIEITVSTGHINLADIKCENLTTVADTGKSKLTDVNVSEQTSVKANTGDVMFTGGFGADLTVKTTTGDVRFEAFDANEMSVTVGTGDVTGSLRTGKRFDAYSETGDVKVPKNTDGGLCKITASTGDIIISVEE